MTAEPALNPKHETCTEKTTRPPPEAMDISIRNARKLYATILRARNGLRGAIERSSLGDIGYYFGWLDSELTKLYAALPDTVKMEDTLSGGGEKPV